MAVACTTASGLDLPTGCVASATNAAGTADDAVPPTPPLPPSLPCMMFLGILLAAPPPPPGSPPVVDSGTEDVVEIADTGDTIGESETADNPPGDPNVGSADLERGTARWSFPPLLLPPPPTNLTSALPAVAEPMPPINCAGLAIALSGDAPIALSSPSDDVADARPECNPVGGVLGADAPPPPPPPLAVAADSDDGAPTKDEVVDRTSRSTSIVEPLPDRTDAESLSEVGPVSVGNNGSGGDGGGGGGRKHGFQQLHVRLCVRMYCFTVKFQRGIRERVGD